MDWFLHCISWKHAPAHVKQFESAGKTWIYQLPATSDTCQQINLTGKMLLLILFLHTNTLQACALIFGCDSSPRSPNVSLFVCHTCLIWRLVPWYFMAEMIFNSDLSKLFLLYSKVTSGMKLMLGFEIIFHKNTDQRMKWGLPLCSNEVNLENPLKSQLLSNKLFEMVFCIILINQHLTRLGGRNSDVSVR